MRYMVGRDALQIEASSESSWEASVALSPRHSLWWRYEAFNESPALPTWP